MKWKVFDFQIVNVVEVDFLNSLAQPTLPETADAERTSHFRIKHLERCEKWNVRKNQNEIICLKLSVKWRQQIEFVGACNGRRWWQDRSASSCRNVSFEVVVNRLTLGRPCVIYTLRDRAHICLSSGAYLFRLFLQVGSIIWDTAMRRVGCCGPCSNLLSSLCLISFLSL